MKVIAGPKLLPYLSYLHGGMGSEKKRSSRWRKVILLFSFTNEKLL